MRPRFGFELGLRSKLFLVLLGAILLAAVATSIPVRGALHVRVSGEFDDRALERVRSRLLAAYELHGNWDFLRRDPSRWSNLLRDAAILPPGPFPSSAGPAPKVVVVSVPLALLDAGRRFVIGDFANRPEHSHAACHHKRPGSGVARRPSTRRRRTRPGYQGE
jgi:hypothetical protein